MNYTADNIKVLDDIEHMRLRSGMYIGESLTPAPLLSEVLDNAIDEAQAGFSNKFVINVNTKTNVYSVRDYGRGIPHGTKKLETGEEKEVLEILLTKANSGGKFNNESYKTSCFTGDTKIKLTDGRSVTFKKLLQEYEVGKQNFCYSCTLEGAPLVEAITNVQVTKYVDELITITLDDGSVVTCTPEHLFLTADGDFIEAEKLTEGCSLMPGYFGSTARLYNHKVQKISRVLLHNKIPVYDLTVSGTNHTFLLDAGVFVHNCGLNGLGVTITNALSKYVKVTSYCDGEYVQIESNQGKNNVITRGETKEQSGTYFEFSPDPECFKNVLIPVDWIINRCKIAAAFGFKSELYVDDKCFTTAATIPDLIVEEEKVSTYSELPVFTVTSNNGEKLCTLLRYTSDTKEKYFGYTNLLHNSMGGTHVQQLSKAIVEVWEDLIQYNKTIRPNIELRKSDYLIGLRAVCAVFIAKPEFSSQTKEKLVVDKTYINDLMELFKKQFKKYLNANLNIAHQLIKRFEEYRVAQNALLSRKEISSLIKVNTDDGDAIRTRSVVSKLIECSSHKREERTLYIVEGDSAASPFKSVRDTRTQAILPLRGKILNCTNLSIKECVQNKEICDIANSLGTGIGSNCDASKSRYDKVIIAADADPDGLQITCLVLALFTKCFPDMLKEGKVYITTPPLYCWDEGNKFNGCMKVADVPKNAVNVHRIKGLGEFDDNQLLYFLVDPKTRYLLPVDWPSDSDAFDKILGTSEGKNQLLKDLGIIVTE